MTKKADDTETEKYSDTLPEVWKARFWHYGQIEGTETIQPKT